MTEGASDNLLKRCYVSERSDYLCVKIWFHILGSFPIRLYIQKVTFQFQNFITLLQISLEYNQILLVGKRYCKLHRVRKK